MLGLEAQLWVQLVLQEGHQEHLLQMDRLSQRRHVPEAQLEPPASEGICQS